MAVECRALQIVHPGALQRMIGQGKTGRFDQMNGHIHAGGKAQDRAGVLRNVGLVEGEIRQGFFPL